MFSHIETASLSHQLCEIEILETAWRKVRANKGGPGSDGVTIQQFETQLPKHLCELASELTEERYYPLPVQKFMMKKSNGSKREISVLALRDRIVQRAVCDLITPIYESKFLDCSFGYRPGRGVPHAVAAVNAIRAEGYEWVVHIDIDNFFDSLDTHILMRFLRASMNEPLVIRLIQMWLDMGGILQLPKLPTWYRHLENTLQHVGDGVDQVINQFLTQRRQNYLDYEGYQNTLLDDEWSIDESDDSETITRNGTLAQTGKDLLTTFGRDGLLLLLSNVKSFWRPLATKQLLVIAPIAMAILAAPTVGYIVKERMNRPRKIGILQGSPLSPLLANIYLHPFDKAMQRSGIRLVRYADDIFLLCRTESRAQHALQHAQKRLAALKLELNRNKTEIAHFRTEIDFLGHIFDAEGCYQPVSVSQKNIIQKQIQHAFKKGTTQIIRSGQYLTQHQKNIRAQLGRCLKKGTHKKQSMKHS